MYSPKFWKANKFFFLWFKVASVSMKINISTALKHWPRQKVFGAPIHLLSGVAGSVPRTAVQFWAWTSPDINVSNSICLEAGESQLKQNVERADYKGLMYDLMTLWPTSTRHRTYWRWHKNQLWFSMSGNLLALSGGSFLLRQISARSTLICHTFLDEAMRNSVRNFWSVIRSAKLPQ